MKYLLFLLLPAFGNAQTFFVSGNDNPSIKKTVEKIRFLGYTVTDSAKADYIVNQLIDGHYKAISFKRNFQGFISITDRETGKEVWKSEIEKATPSIYNGYNASERIFEKINDRYLPDALKKCPKKETAQSK